MPGLSKWEKLGQNLHVCYLKTIPVEAVALLAFPFANHFSASSADVIVCQLRPSTKIFSSVPLIFNDGLIYGDFGPKANASFVFLGLCQFLTYYV